MDTPVTALRENKTIADKLREAAVLLEAQGASPFRAGAYCKAADVVASLPRAVREIFDADGIAGLDLLPYIGRGIAAAIAEILITGGWSQLERLRGALDPVKHFQSVPGIGPQLAERIHETLRVDTLEALEAAAHDGRLRRVCPVREHAALRPCVHPLAPCSSGYDQGSRRRSLLRNFNSTAHRSVIAFRSDSCDSLLSANHCSMLNCLAATLYSELCAPHHIVGSISPCERRKLGTADRPKESSHKQQQKGEKGDSVLRVFSL